MMSLGCSLYSELSAEWASFAKRNAQAITIIINAKKNRIIKNQLSRLSLPADLCNQIHQIWTPFAHTRILPRKRPIYGDHILRLLRPGNSYRAFLRLSRSPWIRTDIDAVDKIRINWRPLYQ